MTNCKTNNNMNHQVVRFLKEKLNLTNFLEVKSSSIVKGKKPHAWQRLTNGRNCSKTDMAVKSQLNFSGNRKKKLGKCCDIIEFLERAVYNRKVGSWLSTTIEYQRFKWVI